MIKNILAPDLLRKAALAVVILLITIAAGRASLASSGGEVEHNSWRWFGGSDPATVARRLDMQFLTPRWENREAEIAKRTRESLIAQALNTRLVRILAFLDEKEGKRAASLRRAELASRLSRRDFGAQILLIEADIRRDDVRSAVGRYDLALRSGVSAQGGPSTILFPLLTAALTEPEVRDALKPYIRKRPHWTYPMLSHALSDSKNAEFVAELISESGGLQEGRVFRQVEASVIQSLVSQFKLESARKFYLSLKGSRAETLSSPRFVRFGVDEFRAPITWSELQMPESEGRFITSGQNKDLKLSGYSATDGRHAIARKFLFLEPGSYGFFPMTRIIPSNPDRKILFEVTCLSKAGNKIIWSGEHRPNSNSFPIVVGQDCPGQYVDILIDGRAGDVMVGSMDIRKEAK